jgi:hypothetical protein
MPVTRSAALPMLLLTLGCGGAKTSGHGSVAPDCATDNECMEKCSLQTCACVIGKCVPEMSLPAAWSAEIAPPVGDRASAVTEIISVVTASGTLPIQPLAPLSATFTFISPLPVPGSANATLRIPPKIPGRPDRVFEVRAEIDPTRERSLKALFSAPANATSGGGGMIRLIPLPPDDQESPPRAFTVGSSSSFTFTVSTSDDVPLRGRLRDASGEAPMARFAARALQDEVVSNTVPIEPTGEFTIWIPLSAAIRPVRVQLAPASTEAHPSYVTTDRVLTGNGAYPNLDVLLPTYTFRSNAFDLTVAGDAPGEPPIRDALVRAVTILTKPDDTLGTASFLRDDVSDAPGVAGLSLLPGTAAFLRPYEVAIVPPASSRFATVCRQTSIAAGGIDGSPPATLQLGLVPRRPLFTGTVLTAEGAPVGNVVIVAKPGPGVAAGCTTTRPLAATTVSDPITGRFELPLDVGSYQIDYDPPGGSPFPRLTELDVAMADNVVREVHLPKAAFVEGIVVGGDGRTPLAGATVRLFEVRCVATTCTGPDRLAPWLRGVAQTDNSGRFRAIVPLNTSN